MSESFQATDTADTLIRRAAASTRPDNDDASTATVLASYVAVAKLADDILREEVHAARSMGLTWEQIGEVFGVTRQAAQIRFGRAVVAD